MTTGESRTARWVAAAAGALLSVALIGPSAADAATIDVTTTTDEYVDPGLGAGCSLREAVEAANTDGVFGGCSGNGVGTDENADVITLDFNSTYVRTRTGTDDTNVNGDLDVLNEDIVILGEGAVIQGTDTLAGDRVIESHEGLVLQTLTLRDGFTGGSGGAARLNASEANDYLNSFYVTVTSSHADGYGGGLANHNGTQFIVFNSTVSGNTANADSGGVDTEEIVATAVSTLRNATITNNTAGADGTGGNGGGVGAYDGEVVLQNSIVAGNTDASPSGVNAPDCYEETTAAGSSIGSIGYSLVGNTSDCGYGAGTGDVLNMPAGLGPLATNPPGNVQTHGLLPGSPAIDAGNPSMSYGTPPACETNDQRNIGRPVGPRCDIGAFEGTLSLPTPPVPPVAQPLAPLGASPPVVRKCKKKRKGRARAVAAKKRGCKRKKRR